MRKKFALLLIEVKNKNSNIYIYSGVYLRMSAPRIWPPQFEIEKSNINEKANESHLLVATSYRTPGDPNFFFSGKILKIKRYVLRYNILG